MTGMTGRFSSHFAGTGGVCKGIAESVLDKVGRIFGFSVIIKFHKKIITQARYIYNTIQQ